MSKLRVAGLYKSFGAHAVLHGIDLTVAAGTLMALLGPSGSGKTTLLRVLCGFERAERGVIEMDGKRIADLGLHTQPERRRIGYVPQEGALFPHLSVAENIVFGLPREARRAQHRVAELLELVGLPASYARRAPQQLSGGQQQRVALARALAPAPALIMLDEPFSALDAALRIETREAVTQALAAAGATAVLVTHDQAEALSLGHEVAVLWQGRLLQTDSPANLYRYPVTRELASFIGEAVMVRGRASGATVDCALGCLALAKPVAAGPVDVMVRPEQIRLVHEAEAGGAAASRTFRATVCDIAFYGQDASVGLRLHDVASAAPLMVRARVPGYMSPAPGAVISFMVDGSVLAYPVA